MNYMKDYRPEGISFVNGAVIMIFEILGSRIVWPYIGTSLYVWTSIIAIVLGALSLWYFFWWKIADTYKTMKIVSFVYLLTVILFFLLFLFKDSILLILTTQILDVKMISLVATLCLFAPISFLLWIVPPVIIRLQLQHISNSGAVIGKFESIWTFWSITGTLVAGFILIPLFWVSYLILILATLCLALSSVYFFRWLFVVKGILLFLIVSAFFWQSYDVKKLAREGRYVIDTPYSHITVWDGMKDNKKTRSLYIDNITHAWMFYDSNELLYEYTKYYHLFDVFNPKARDVLLFWGAAYSYPKSFVAAYPDKKLSVVEIDPDITKVARRFFWLKDYINLEIFHQDARVFLNTTKKKFDVILWDAFGSFYSVPYQLTTKEVAQKKYNILSDNWIVIVNLIGALDWKKSLFILSEYKTYASVFPEVFLIPVSTISPFAVQNIMLVALKNPEKINYMTQNSTFKEYLKKKVYPVIWKDIITLTDDYAPVDYFTSKLID